MQKDLFAAENEPPGIVLEAHSSSSYAPRTGDNARKADVTVAFAVDFTTAGERLTHKVAGAKYVGIPYGSPVEEAADKLASFMRKVHGDSLNVAGNGIYTLTRHRVDQQRANAWVHAVLRIVHAQIGISAIRSGGQTGIDTAGLVAGIALGIPVTGLYPKGFKQRLANESDVMRTAADLEAELLRMAEQLR